VKYEFPHITHLDEVRAAIAGSPEFIVAQRDWGYVVNYLVMTPDAFPPVYTTGGSAEMRETATRNKALRRECRGVCFDLEGRLISRPFHKFFNVNQIDETQAHRIDLTQPHVILEKMDGSMIRPLPIGDAYRLSTKMGITDVSMQAEVWLADHPNYDLFIRDMIGAGLTPIFEWCSRKQKIVIDYPEDRLVLTAVRHNRTGVYYGMHALRYCQEDYDLDLVREYAGTVDNMEALLSETRDLEGQEGWIIRFDDGHMLKLKGDAYVSMHRAKDSIMRENGVIEMILAEKLDDVKPVLSDDDRRRLEDFETKFYAGLNRTASEWAVENQMIRSVYGNDRKRFAMEKAPHLDPHLRGSVFKAWDDPDFDWWRAVVDVVSKNIGTQTRADAARGLWGGARWDYGMTVEAE